MGMSKQPIRPLHLVHSSELIPGKKYLIREKRPEFAHLNCKGVFVRNEAPLGSNFCTISHFTNTQAFNSANYIDLGLQDYYWNYYEADAIERSYVAQVLRIITGDPNFIFEY